MKRKGHREWVGKWVRGCEKKSEERENKQRAQTFKQAKVAEKCRFTLRYHYWNKHNVLLPKKATKPKNCVPEYYIKTDTRKYC